MKFILRSALAGLIATSVMGAEQWDVFETSFTSTRKYDNPFVDVQVDVVFRSGEQQWLVPAFWAGSDKWTVRFAPPEQGDYTFQVKCSDPANQAMNGAAQPLRVTAYTGDNPLLKHGFLRVAGDKRHFEHADSTPFLWLADTWWKNLSKRMTWEGFQELTADRKAKGFNAVQIVCGPYPDENMMEARWENEGGMPYLKGRSFLAKGSVRPSDSRCVPAWHEDQSAVAGDDADGPGGVPRRRGGRTIPKPVADRATDWITQDDTGDERAEEQESPSGSPRSGLDRSGAQPGLDAHPRIGGRDRHACRGHQLRRCGEGGFGLLRFYSPCSPMRATATASQNAAPDCPSDQPSPVRPRGTSPHQTLPRSVLLSA